MSDLEVVQAVSEAIASQAERKLQQARALSAARQLGELAVAVARAHNPEAARLYASRAAHAYYFAA